MAMAPGAFVADIKSKRREWSNSGAQDVPCEVLPRATKNKKKTPAHMDVYESQHVTGGGKGSQRSFPFRLSSAPHALCFNNCFRKSPLSEALFPHGVSGSKGSLSWPHFVPLTFVWPSESVVVCLLLAWLFCPPPGDMVKSMLNLPVSWKNTYELSQA